MAKKAETNMGAEGVESSGGRKGGGSYVGTNHTFINSRQKEEWGWGVGRVTHPSPTPHITVGGQFPRGCLDNPPTHTHFRS